MITPSLNTGVYKMIKKKQKLYIKFLFCQIFISNKFWRLDLYNNKNLLKKLNLFSQRQNKMYDSETLSLSL